MAKCLNGAPASVMWSEIISFQMAKYVNGAPLKVRWGPAFLALGWKNVEIEPLLGSDGVLNDQHQDGKIRKWSPYQDGKI